MSTRVKAYLLAGVMLVLLLVLLGGYGRQQPVSSVLANQNFTPINVKDPTLQIDRIKQIQKLEYEGSGRNIFAYGSARRQQQIEQPVEQPVDPPEIVPVEPPRLEAPFKFYGLATNPATGRRRAFFTNGEEIWIAEEGQMIDRGFRLVLIATSSAEVEQVSSRKRITLPLEEPPQ